jgi:hypothetical protein
MPAILLRYPGIVLNLLFLAYFAFFEPGVMIRLSRVIERDARDPLLAVAFLAAPFLELAGFYLIVPAMIDRLSQAPRQPGTLPVLVWQAHLVLNIVLLLNGFSCIGFDPDSGPPLLGIVLMALMIIKEVGYLLYWVVQTDPKRFASFSFIHAAQKRTIQPTHQFLAGLLLTPFAMLSFSGFWSLLIARQPIHWSQPEDAAVELALAIFIFLVVFFAARSVYLIEEWAFLRGRWPVLMWVGTLLLNLLLALASLPAA